jgi:hypothetical protein
MLSRPMKAVISVSIEMQERNIDRIIDELTDTPAWK